MSRILVTGGAGFIGSHLCDALVDAGHSVRVLDCLDEQVHGTLLYRGTPPDYLNPAVDFCRGDVLDVTALRGVLHDVDAVFHFAARVGVGQSMYEPAKYVEANCLGTAVLLKEIAKQPVKRLIVASSMSVYGEARVGPVNHFFWTYPVDDPRNSAMELKASGEGDRADLRSIYALTKYDQERMCLIFGEAYGIPTTALRFFNVYGPRQALSNPYTGVIAIFASRLLNDKPPLIYEDGLQSRDFLSVHDIVQGCMLALESEATGVFNIGSGIRTTVKEVAEFLARVLGKDIAPVYTGNKRKGDIRHCFANISKAKRKLGYEPRVTLEAGFAELADWLKDQTAVDRVEDAARELEERGLVA